MKALGQKLDSLNDSLPKFSAAMDTEIARLNTVKAGVGSAGPVVAAKQGTAPQENSTISEADKAKAEKNRAANVAATKSDFTTAGESGELKDKAAASPKITNGTDGGGTKVSQDIFENNSVEDGKVTWDAKSEKVVAGTADAAVPEASANTPRKDGDDALEITNARKNVAADNAAREQVKHDAFLARGAESQEGMPAYDSGTGMAAKASAGQSGTALPSAREIASANVVEGASSADAYTYQRGKEMGAEFDRNNPAAEVPPMTALQGAPPPNLQEKPLTGSGDGPAAAAAQTTPGNQPIQTTGDTI
ncbi:MAG: hypothetical protein EOP11_24225, partial [Proteobacteria bacterium]